MDEEQTHLQPLPQQSFSWLRIVKIIFAVVLVAAVLGGAYFLFTYRPAKVLWASWVLDRHENYFSCEQLPFLPEVQKEMLLHKDVIVKMEAVGAIGVIAEQIKCPSSDGSYYFIKGDILMQYKGRQQKDAIEKIIGDNFFGIPYRGEPSK